MGDEAMGDSVQGAKKLDRRVVRSRRLIIDAFERLLLKESLEDITVSAIAREADIDRKTFYQHFGSIDGLIDYVVTEEVERVLDDVERARDERGSADTEQDLHAFLKSVNEVMCRDIVLNRRFFEGIPADRTTYVFVDGEQVLAEPMEDGLRQPFERGIIERGILSKHLPGQYVSWCVSFLFGGMLSVYRSWLLSNQEASLEEITDVINQLIIHGIESLDIAS